MLKLFRRSHGHLFRTLDIQLRNPNFVLLISHLHNPGKALVPDSEQGFVLNEIENVPSTKSLHQRDPSAREKKVKQLDQVNSMETSELQISHPWPEWVELMEQLLKKGYFEEVGNPFQKRDLDAKDANRIRTASLNFARDRFDLIRYFSRKDIQVVSGSGCPVIDRKVVNSGKRLRAFAGVDERNVCSSCILRGNCERAYVKAREAEGGQTVDVMRLLLTYGLDPIIGMVENKPCLDKFVEKSVRRLLKEMVEHSMKELNADSHTATITKWNSCVQESSSHKGQGYISVSVKQGNWMCHKCNFINLARNAKCLHCDELFQRNQRLLGEDQSHLALKKGDWICDKCNFLNFAKNTKCLQCNEKPPKRQLGPGEWACDSCNYINFRRNMACVKCNHRRPKGVIFGRQSPTHS